jgi:hypothetical protein
MKLHRLLLATVFAVAPTLQAAVLVEIKAADGVTSIYRDGPQIRMEMADNPGYMVVNTDKQTMHVVMPEERRVMDMSDTLRNAPANAPASQVSVKFDKQGSGPQIAGYKTTRYSYSAGGKNCGTVFTSPDAMEDAGLHDMFDMMERMAAQAQAMAAAFNQNMGPCEQADQKLSEKIVKIGAPLRMLDANGKSVSEVIKIDKKAKLPANAFVIPAGYQVHNTGQMMQEVQRQMPDMQKMMEQMQQSGELPPEALEQMKKMQQMMQQQQ